MPDILPGQWTETRAQCECVCTDPLPELKFYVSVNESPIFDFGGIVATDDTTPAADGTRVQLQFRYDPVDPPRPFQMRYRLVTISEDESGRHYSDVSVEQVLTDPTGSGILLDLAGLDTITLPVVSAGSLDTISLVGPQFEPTAALTGTTQFAKLTKAGFPAYLGDEGDAATIYRQEAVVGAGAPGCDATGIAPQDFSGAQHFVAASGDPSGSYVDTLSRDLKLAGYASSPLGDARLPKRFGRITQSATLRTMTQAYTCGTESRTKELQLALSDEYLTSDLTGAIDAILADEAATPPPYTSGPVSLDRLSPEETFCAKRRSDLVIACPIIPGVYLEAAAAFPITVRWVRRATNLTTGEHVDSSELHTFAAVSDSDTSFAPAVGRPVDDVDPFEFAEEPVSQTEVTLINFTVDSIPAFGQRPFLEFLPPLS